MTVLSKRSISLFCLLGMGFLSNSLFAAMLPVSSTAPADFESSYFNLSSERANLQNRQYFYNPDEKTLWQKIKGEPIPNRLILGMFSLHLRQYFKSSHHSSNDNWNNQLVAISYHGYFIGTLINSLYKRAYAVAIERYWFTTEVSRNFDYSLGYRLGLITGYTQKTYPLAKYSPVLPFPQLIFDMSIYHVQVELMLCFQVASLGFAYRF